MQPYLDQKLYESLLELNVLDKKILEDAWKKARDTKTSLAEILISKDLIADNNLGKVISELIKVPLIRLNEVNIPEEILEIVPEEMARKQKVIAFGMNEKGLNIAMANPSSKTIPEFIAKKTGEKVNVFYATEHDIEQALGLYKKNLQKSFNNLLQEQIDQAGKITEKQIPISKIVDLLIEYAYASLASDIHFEPQEKDGLVRFRIDGVLHDVLILPKEIHEQIVSRVKVLSKLRIDEHLSAQDGKMQVKMETEDLDIRISVVPTTHGESVVMRLLSSRSRSFGLSDLGMSDNDLRKVKNAFSKPFGMVLSTGPTGSGKTTTIYAILKILNTREKNIATIEDPVEYEVEGISQIQVNPKTNLTFAEGLRSILRQDPDIMFVGEIRDDETAGIAVNSAMTGHLVLSTLHTNDAPTALPRLIDMDIEPFLVASTVNAIIGQRLVRKLCNKCRYSAIIKLSDLVKQLGAEVVKKHFDGKEEVRLYAGKGCNVCHETGYAGRIGIFEVLEVTEDIKKLIVGKVDSSTILLEAIREGMTTMVDDGLEKVIRGITTVEEVIRVTKE